MKRLSYWLWSAGLDALSFREAAARKKRGTNLGGGSSSAREEERPDLPPSAQAAATRGNGAGEANENGRARGDGNPASTGQRHRLEVVRRLPNRSDIAPELNFIASADGCWHLPPPMQLRPPLAAGQHLSALAQLTSPK